MRKLADDCFFHDKDRIRHADVLAILKERLRTVTDIESCGLGLAGNRVLANPVIAERDVPLTDNSAVDGYAFAHNDYNELGGWFEVSDRIAAGHPRKSSLPKRTAARIFTGASMPPGTDTVAMQEDCEPHVQDDRAFVAIPPGLKPGANCRKAGEDVSAGEVVIEKGIQLRPPEIAALASLGVSSVHVHKRLRLGLVSSGDELVDPETGTDLKDGEVYDANRFMLRNLLNRLPIEIVNYGILPDNRDSVADCLKRASVECQIILTSGGASLGEEDHMISVLDELGNRHVWQLAIKPGRPMSMGQIDDCVYVGLPGNPVAAFVCFVLYVYPMILKLAGAGWKDPEGFSVKAGFDFPKKKTDRREFWRGVLVRDEFGEQFVQKFDRDGSGLISGLRFADGLIEIPEDVSSIQNGTLVRFLPFSQWL